VKELAWSLLVHKYLAPRQCRTANLEFSTAPTTDLTRAPSSWGQVVRPFRSRRSDHLVVRIPGVILEAVTTSLSRPPAPYPPHTFVILHIALTCFHQSISYLMRIDLTTCIRKIVQDRHALNFIHYYVFHNIGITVLYSLLTHPPHADTKVRYNKCLYESCLVRRVCHWQSTNPSARRVAPIAHPKPSAPTPHPTKRLHLAACSSASARRFHT